MLFPDLGGLSKDRSPASGRASATTSNEQRDRALSRASVARTLHPPRACERQMREQRGRSFGLVRSRLDLGQRAASPRAISAVYHLKVQRLSGSLGLLQTGEQAGQGSRCGPSSRTEAADIIVAPGPRCPPLGWLVSSIPAVRGRGSGVANPTMEGKAARCRTSKANVLRSVGLLQASERAAQRLRC